MAVPALATRRGVSRCGRRPKANLASSFKREGDALRHLGSPLNLRVRCPCGSPLEATPSHRGDPRSAGSSSTKLRAAPQRRGAPGPAPEGREGRQVRVRAPPPEFRARRPDAGPSVQGQRGGSRGAARRPPGPAAPDVSG